MLTKRQLQWTGEPEADRLISDDATALLIGFCLDQQITVEAAFMGPLRIKQRLGTVDAAKLARMDPAKVEKAFRTPPAVHRYPANMSSRVLSLCSTIANTYGNDASGVWTEAKDASDLQQRITDLPGFGAMKAQSLLAVIGKHIGVRPKGWETIAPKFPTLGDVTTVAEREAYQKQKRAHKAAIRAKAAK